jgi:hypothetical protein
MLKLKTDQLRKNLASSAVAIGVLAGVNMFSAPAQAQTFVCTGLNNDCQSVALSTLLAPNASYQVGDKLFDNFRAFISNGTENGSFLPGLAPISSEIFITGFQTGPNWYDLLFTTSKWEVDPGQSIDTAFQYDVTSLGTPITSVDLDLIGHGIIGNGEIDVTETVTLLNPGGPPITLLAQSIPPGPKFVIEALIPPQQKISISKDIGLNGNTGNATISILGQSYHQGTPETSSILGLLAFSGLGLSILRKQKN